MKRPAWLGSASATDRASYVSHRIGGLLVTVPLLNLIMLAIGLAQGDMRFANRLPLLWIVFYVLTAPFIAWKGAYDGMGLRRSVDLLAIGIAPALLAFPASFVGSGQTWMSVPLLVGWGVGAYFAIFNPPPARGWRRSVILAAVGLACIAIAFGCARMAVIYWPSFRDAVPQQLTAILLISIYLGIAVFLARQGARFLGAVANPAD